MTQILKFTIRPETAFGTPLVGDTLFGHVCWAIRELFGEAELVSLLQGYTDNSPFAVVSDAFPSGYIPLPSLPSVYWKQEGDVDRKVLKKRQWLPIQALTKPSECWQLEAQSDKDVVHSLMEQNSLPSVMQMALVGEYVQSHNTLNRQTSTTGKGGQFAPYDVSQLWLAADVSWDIYVVLDTQKLSQDKMHQVLSYIGQVGYGRDASIGLGKFTVLDVAPMQWSQPQESNAVLTLAASCPQQFGFDETYSFYHVQTRFGRHGNVQATSGNPFKKPVLMAKTGAVFALKEVKTPLDFVGQGITGVSKSLAGTVQQGYAPVIFMKLHKTRLEV